MGVLSGSFEWGFELGGGGGGGGGFWPFLVAFSSQSKRALPTELTCKVFPLPDRLIDNNLGLFGQVQFDPLRLWGPRMHVFDLQGSCSLEDFDDEGSSLSYHQHGTILASKLAKL